MTITPEVSEFLTSVLLEMRDRNASGLTLDCQMDNGNTIQFFIELVSVNGETLYDDYATTQTLQ